jgi:hypothetical protein
LCPAVSVETQAHIIQKTENTGQPGLDDFVTDLQMTQETAMEFLVQAKYYNKG